MDKATIPDAIQKAWADVIYWVSDGTLSPHAADWDSLDAWINDSRKLAAQEPMDAGTRDALERLAEHGHLQGNPHYWKAGDWIQAQLAAQPQAQWQPVEDGRYCQNIVVTVYDEATVLTLEDDYDFINVTLPDDLRLCRPAPAPAGAYDTAAWIAQAVDLLNILVDAPFPGGITDTINTLLDTQPDYMKLAGPTDAE